MPLQSTSGAASYDAFGGGAAAKVNYIEDFFQSYLRTGTGASATVTTGLDGSTKETLVWTKSRSAATNHKLIDNVRGVTKALSSNTTGAEATDTQGLTAFSATGYTIGTNTDYNNSGATYVDWQWVAQPKFFDVVTYTGNETAGKTVNHSLGSDPGCIIIKRISPSGYNWFVYHRSNPTKYTNLNLTNAETNFTIVTSVSSTNFTLPADASTNANGIDYVAYLFAHNAGGFGLTGTDNVISCGSFSTGSGGKISAPVNLGYEAQWLLAKNVDSAENWVMYDIMRGMNNTGYAALNPNTSGAEYTGTSAISPTATGFDTPNASGPFASSANYIYIAIRRGPMKVPTSGTSVFTSIYQTPQSAGTLRTVGFPADLMIGTYTAAATPRYVNTRLTGLANNSGSAQTTPKLQTQSTAAESNAYPLFYDVWNTTARDGDYIFGSNGINWLFGRAPSFFDEVCYTGTGANRTVTHNLGVAPELMIVKRRDSLGAWNVWNTYIAGLDAANVMQLESTDAVGPVASVFNSTSPTSSVFTVGTAGRTNASGGTYVAYLFASCAGVSKVGSYTGNGSTQTINCGFTGGARFVMVKATSTTGNWIVADSARGIVAGNDPALYLNSTAAEVTGLDWIDADNSGFVVNETATIAANTNGVSYIFFAVA